MAEINDSQYSRTDCGLLLLRVAGLLLVATAGWQKVHDLLVAFQAGKPLASVGVTPLITKMGLPLPFLCALYVVVNESLGATLIALGLFTRVAALCAAMSMTGAFYTSMRFGWEPLRAFIYLFIFVSLAVAGAGRFSLDSRYIKWQVVSSSVDAGLLILRAGLLTFFVLLLTLKKVNAMGSFAVGPAIVFLVIATCLAVPVILGYFTRQLAIISCALWAFGAVGNLIAGQKWDLFPYRDVLVFLLFLVLAVTGPGRYSLSGFRQRQ